MSDVKASLSNLIAAFQIFLKYGDIDWPTHCSHDQLSVLVNPGKVSADDRAELARLGFLANEDEEHFYSFRYGSA